MAMDERDEAAGPAYEPEGGESACFLDRVCPECGGVADVSPPADCPRCGAALGTD